MTVPYRGQGVPPTQCPLLTGVEGELGLPLPPPPLSPTVYPISGVAGGTTLRHVGLNHKQLYPAVLLTRCVDPCA